MRGARKQEAEQAAAKAQSCAISRAPQPTPRTSASQMDPRWTLASLWRCILVWTGSRLSEWLVSSYVVPSASPKGGTEPSVDNIYVLLYSTGIA